MIEYKILDFLIFSYFNAESICPERSWLLASSISSLLSTNIYSNRREESPFMSVTFVSTTTKSKGRNINKYDIRHLQL